MLASGSVVRSGAGPAAASDSDRSDQSPTEVTGSVRLGLPTTLSPVPHETTTARRIADGPVQDLADIVLASPMPQDAMVRSGSSGRLRLDRLLGSGFVDALSDGYVVTNHHVISEGPGWNDVRYANRLGGVYASVGASDLDLDGELTEATRLTFMPSDYLDSEHPQRWSIGDGVDDRRFSRLRRGDWLFGRWANNRPGALKSLTEIGALSGLLSTGHRRQTFLFECADRNGHLVAHP